MSDKPDQSPAVNALVPRVYEELRQIAARYMARERRGHTLQTTALVHEAYVRLVDQQNLHDGDREQFFAIAANVIRRILVDHARGRDAEKRGGADRQRMSISGVDVPDGADAIDLLALEDALARLEAMSERAAKVVTMRYFGGMTVDEVARALGVSPRTVADDWAMARAWLRRELEPDGTADMSSR
jgi:RNA polymerase sigma factor (TIGR02999 family)